MARTADPIDVVWAGWSQGIRPPTRLSVSEWSDQHRVLDESHAAEPGLYRGSRTPYMREIMDALGPECAARRVVFLKGAQVGATEAGCNWLGWSIDHSPCPVLVVWPTLDEAKKNSKKRISRMIQASPRLRRRVAPVRSRDGGNTVLQKEFPGGNMTITGANSPQGLASMPAQRLMLDEVDRFPAELEGEGDPVNLAVARTRTFPNAKVFLASTPTIEGSSRIASEFELSDKRSYLLPCPHCGHAQPLEWQRIRWEVDDPTTAAYQCVACDKVVAEHHKGAMLAAGKWVPEHPERSDTVRGYFLNALYSPPGWYSWEDAVRDFLEAKRRPEPSALRVWVNTVLAQTWKEKGQQPDWAKLYNRRESWKSGVVPRGGLVLTCGVDVQGGHNARLEAEVVAWGPDTESWSVDYVVIPGDAGDAETWQKLDRYLGNTWPNEDGLPLRVSKVAVDAGYDSSAVYKWVRSKPATWAMAVVGRARIPVLVSHPTQVDVRQSGRRVKHRAVLLWKVGVDTAKAELYGLLNQPQPTHPERDGYPPGYAHFPMDRSEEWFKQLTAEKLVPKVRAGRRVYDWEPTRERNEALDCRVYARAAAFVLGVDRWSADDWDTLRRTLGAPPAQAQPTKGSQSSYLRSKPWQSGRSPN